MKDLHLREAMALTNPWIENFFVGPLQMRCSVVTDSKTGDTIIIDGGEGDEFAQHNGQAP